MAVDIDSVDTSRERYSGYGTQATYQKDLKKFFDGEICGALTNERRFCGSKPMENGRCRLHGGSSPNGVDHPRTTHGGYSRYLPKELLTKYHDANENDELLSLRDETALITTRIFELAEKVQETAGKRNFNDLISTYKRWQSAKRKGVETSGMIKQDFEDMMDDIHGDLRIWDEIGEMVNLKRRLVDSEQKKMANMNQYVPVEKVMLLIGALMDIVVSEVEELNGVLMDQEMIEETNTKIAKRFNRITRKQEI